MLKAGVFDDFKGATTLLLWGDRAAMATLRAGLSALLDRSRSEFAIAGSEIDLTIGLAPEKREASTLRADGVHVRWVCSRETIELAANLVEPLLHEAGHQFLAVDGLAEQVIIARDEYPADMR